MSAADGCKLFSLKDLKCEQVVVYKDRAEIKRSLKTSLKKGETELIVNNVSNMIERDSVRIEGRGDANVLDVVCQSKQVETENSGNNEKAKELLDEIKDLEKAKEKLNFKLERLDKQANALNEFALNLSKPNSATATNGASNLASSKENVENFLSFLDVYAERNEVLDGKKFELQQEVASVEEKIKVANENYNRLNVYNYNESM